MKLKISWVKYEKDDVSFKMPERLGFDDFNLSAPEQTDEKLKELITNRYDTIILTNEIAGFSEDIIKKYVKDRNVNIIIALDKE